MKLHRKILMIVIILSLVAVYTALITILAVPLLGRDQLPNKLRLDKADTHHGTVGQPLKITVNGNGFDKETRFSLVLDSGNQQAIIEKIETFGAIDIMLRDGQSLYLNIREQQIQQLDISNADHPKFQQKYPSIKKTTALARHQERFWATTGWGELFRLDKAEQPIATRLISGVITQLAVNDDGTMYVATGRQGLMIFRTQPGHVEPEQIGALRLPGTILSVLISGKLAFAGGSQTGLHICDIADPSVPKLLATLPQPGIIQDIALRKNLVLLATTQGLSVIDIANPRQPRPLSKLSVGRCYKMAIDGNRVLLAAGVGGLLMVDISHPENPRISGHLTPGDSIRCLAIKDDRVYLGTDGAGLLVADLNRLQGHPDWRPSLNNLPISINPAEKHSRLSNEHLATLRSMVQQQLPVNCFLQKNMVYNETAAYFCTNCGLATISTNGSGKLDLLKQPLAYASDIWLSGTTLYVAGAKEPISLDALHQSLGKSTLGLQIFDLGKPLKPHAQGFIKTGDLVKKMLIDHDRTYLAIKEQEVMIVDIRDTDHPHTLGMVRLPWPEQHFANYQSIYLKDDVLYVACGRAGLQIFDIGNPHDPRRISAINTPGGWVNCVAGQNDQLFTHNFSNDLQLYDIGNAHAPQLTGTLDRFSGVRTIDVRDNKLLITFHDTLQSERALPLVAENVDLRSNAQVNMVFPAPVFAGDYRLYAFNRQGRWELPDIIHIKAAQK